MEFSELEVHPDLKRALDEAGYVTAMPVQAMTFPHAFVGKDIYAQSQTGTGKTAAFLISIYHRIMSVSTERHRKVLILAPTRELAVQIHGEAEKLGKYLDISCGAFYGGVSYGPQVDMLRENVQVIIGTPGRIIDLVQQGKMLLKEVGFLVIDEADRMFDMGFIDDIRKLLRYLPPAGQRQTFLYSATLGLRVKDLAWEYMVDPVEISIEPEHMTVDLVTQELYHVGNHEKLPLLLGLLDREKPDSALIFCNQKFMTEELARRLKVNGFDCEYIMGDLPQSKRLDIIERLKAGKLHFLVATDVAARGLDVEALDLVVNYDVPEDAESYVHRIGRTARAGKSGKAITLACEKFVFGLPSIEKFIGNKIPVMKVETELLFEDKSAGIRSGYGRDRGPARGDGRGGRPSARSGGHGGAGYGDARGGRSGGVSRGEPRRETREADTRRAAPAPVRRPQEAPSPRPRRVPEAAMDEGARRGDTRDGVNPYAVSQEERMRQYKERYGGPADRGDKKSEKPETGREGGREAGREGGRKGGSRQGEGRKVDSRRPDIRQPQVRDEAQKGRAPEAQKGRQPRPQDRQQPAQGRKTPQTTVQTGRAKTGQTEKAGKPGLFDRIKGLFGAKKN